MKQILLLACGLLMSFSAQAQSFENAKDAVKNMGVGWNLGNTLDANVGIWVTRSMLTMQARLGPLQSSTRLAGDSL